jgi:superfamily II DNA or RNA helicase
LQAKLNKPIETLAIGADEADDIIDDLVDYGGTVYEAGSTDFDTWAREIRSTLGEGVEEYLRPAFEGIRARMEASRGQAAQGAVPEAPAGPAGVAGQAGPAPPGPGAGPVERHPERPGDERTRRIITARDDVTPTVDESVIPQSLAQHLTPAQRQGVAASLKALEEVGAFANADMTGVGKTREQIAAAKILADRGHKVVIVSPQQVLQLRKLKDQWAFSGSYKKDADAMGVVLKPWTSGPVEAGAVTYVTSYHRFQNLPVDDNTVMIWDEAHKLKNISSETSKTGLRMIRASGGNLFFSATPADMAHHVHYMVESGLFGKVSAADVFKRMGLIQRKQRTPKGAVMIWEANPALGLQKVLENMEKEFTELTRQGRMIKREIALDGVTVLFTAIPPSPGAMMVQNKIETAYINEYGDRLVGIRRASMLQHQRRALETFKVEQTIAAIKASLAENRKVVVFMARVNYSEVAIKRVVRDAFGNVVGEERDVVHQSDGTVKLMREALAREGITDISEIHGGASGTTGSMDDFQAGKTRVVLATVEKGGTGINLDDVVGNAPRDMVIVTSPFSAVDMVQAIGRVWRMTTKSYPRIHVLYADTNIDSWNMGIIARKMKMLNAVVSGDVPALDVGTQGIGEGDFIGGTGEEQMGVEEPLEVTPEQEVVPEREGMAVGGARTPTRPAPPQSQVRRMFGTKAADTPRKDQMIQAMAEALRMAKSGALAIQGHVVGKGVLGWRHKLSGNIRARKGTDVDTFAHEFGHGLQGTSMVRGVMTGLQISNQELQPFAAEMDALTQVQGVKGPKLSEGFAEFARLYATDPALARQVAPTFYPWFESRLATVPDLEQAFNAFRDQILALRASTPEERIGRMIATREKRPLIERAKQAASIGELQRQGQEHIFQFVNRWLPFQQMVQLVDPEGTKLAADQDPNKLGRTMGGSIYNAHAALMGDPDHPSVPQGRLDPTTDEPIPGTKSFFQILKPVGNRINDFRTYAMARVMESRAMSDRPIYQQQAEHLRKLGDLSSVDVADVIARLEATHPDFNGVMDEWQGFNDAFLEWVGSSDLKGPQEIAAIKDAIELYVPLGRLMDNPGDPQAVGALGTKVGLGKGFHRTRGTSERIVLDPLELYQSNLLAIISAVKRNEVLARTLDLTENKALATGKFLGMQLEKVATPMKATTVQLASFRRELEDAFRDAGISLDILDQLDLNRLATIFRPSRDNLPANEMVVYRRGTPHVVQILNPMLMRSIGALTGKDMPMMAENTAWATMAFNTFLRGPARMLRRGVVLSPSFMPAHMAREQQEAMAAGWGPIPPFFRGILESDKTYRRFLAGGGRIFSYRNVSPEALARNIQDLKDGAWYQGKLRRDVRHWAEKILRVWDETTRVGVAGLAIEKARPVDVLAGRRSVNIEAGYQAREAGIDFDLHGANQQFRRYMQAVTFMNPAFQGMYRNARMFREMYRNPAGRIGRGMLYIGGLTMFAEILGYLLNKDDPRYQALTDEQRNMNFYLIPPGLRIASDEWETLSLEDQERRSNEMFSMPKAYGLGWVFATAPRQILEWANGSEPALFQRLAKSFWQASRVEALPTVVRVIGEIATNKDFYFNRDINKTWQRNLPPPMQGRPGGPAGAVELSKAFQSVPGLNKLTPNDIEHIFRGLAGYYGQYALSATDRILALTKGDPAAPEMRLAEYPGVNRFLARFPPTFSKPQEEFYDFYKQVTGAMQALRGLPESQQESFRAAHEFELQESGVVAGHAAQLKNQRRTLDRIRTDTTMDAATKANARERVLLESFNESRRVMQEIRRDRVAYDESRQLEYAR